MFWFFFVPESGLKPDPDLDPEKFENRIRNPVPEKFENRIRIQAKSPQPATLLVRHIYLMN